MIGEGATITGWVWALGLHGVVALMLLGTRAPARSPYALPIQIRRTPPAPRAAPGPPPSQQPAQARARTAAMARGARTRRPAVPTDPDLPDAPDRRAPATDPRPLPAPVPAPVQAAPAATPLPAPATTASEGVPIGAAPGQGGGAGRAGRGGGARGARDVPVAPSELSVEAYPDGDRCTIPHNQYPPEARRRWAQGLTQLRLLVDDTGRVRSARVLTGADPTLDATGERWLLERCRFQPARDRTGRPVASMTTYTIEWSIVSP